MAYIINTYNTAQLTVVEDGTVDQTTDLKLVGKNYAGYGEIQNENFVFLLENFAGENQPPKALSGQVWFDAGLSKLKFYDGTKWRTTGGSETGDTAPAGQTAGDFWWDTQNEQLYVFNGTDWILVGPQGTGTTVTQFQSRTVRDDTGTNRPIICSVINDEVKHIISGFHPYFTIHPDDRNGYPGFDTIHEGLTLQHTLNSTSGVTSQAIRYWGTASNSDRLGGFTADKYIKYEGAAFQAAVTFGDDGLSVGDDNDLKLRIVNGNQAIIGNEVGLDLFFQVRDDSNNVRMPFRLTHNEVLPGYNIIIDPTSESFSTTNAGTRQVNIGSTTHSFNYVYASEFKGTADNAKAVSTSFINAQSTVETGFYTADARNTNGVSIVARDISGDIHANLFRGTATAAKYADLAEMYLSDKVYEPGTVLVIGGDAEVTQSVKSNDSTVIGVVSTSPAHIMNSELEGVKACVALRGRVPCKVIGNINKGDLLVTSDTPGVAKAASDNYTALQVIGKSLENYNLSEVGLIEIIV